MVCELSLTIDHPPINIIFSVRCLTVMRCRGVVTTDIHTPLLIRSVITHRHNCHVLYCHISGPSAWAIRLECWTWGGLWACCGGGRPMIDAAAAATAGNIYGLGIPAGNVCLEERKPNKHMFPTDGKTQHKSRRSHRSCHA